MKRNGRSGKRAEAKSRRRKEEPRSAVMVEQARLLKALAHPLRIAIFEALGGGEKTVGELVERLGTKAANTSRHLALMRAAGLLNARKGGLHVYYSIKVPCLFAVFSCLEDGLCCLAEEQVEIQDWLRRKNRRRKD